MISKNEKLKKKAVRIDNLTNLVLSRDSEIKKLSRDLKNLTKQTLDAHEAKNESHNHITESLKKKRDRLKTQKLTLDQTNLLVTGQQEEIRELTAQIQSATENLKFREEEIFALKEKILKEDQILGDQEGDTPIKPLKLNFDEGKPNTVTFLENLDSAEGEMSPDDCKIFFWIGFAIFFRIVFWLRICQPEWGFIEFAKLWLRFSGIWHIRVAWIKKNLNSGF